MDVKTYTTLPRVGWGAGPWDTEPDKMQWPDEATGLPCLAVRGLFGSWCGYVGLPPGHPLHGKDYNDVSVEVHGGLTFSEECQPLAPESQSICHVPGPGEPDHVWWLGFDCAHSSDYMPDPRMRSYLSGAEGLYRPTYKPLSYVQEQCAELAKQLAEANIV